MTISPSRRLRAFSAAVVVGALVSILVGPAEAAPDVARADGTRVVVWFDHLHSVHNTRTAHRYLKRTTAAFQRFAARRGAEVRRDDAGCQRNSGIYVEAFTRGYAIGGVGVCGGYEALWTNHVRGGAPGGHWREVFGSQDGWYCPALKRYHVPSALVGTSCYSPSRNQVIEYHQA